MQQLGGLDAVFVHAEQHGLPMHISSFSVYNPASATDKEDSPTSPSGNRVNFRRIVDFYHSVISRELPILRSKLLCVPMNLDQPYWAEDEQFNIEYHMRYTALPAPGGWNELCHLLSTLHAQALNRNHPLWEVYVIDGLHTAMDVPEGCFGILLKVHHAIMDGATGMAIFTALHTMDKTILAQPSVPKIPADPKPGRMALLGKAYQKNTARTYKLMKTLTRAIPVYRNILKGIEEKRLRLIENKPKTRFNREISPHRVVNRLQVQISDIRRIKSLVPGATINDVALSIIGGALRRYLASHGELPASSLVASTPINVRSQKNNPAHSKKSGNKANVLSVMNCTLGSEFADPLQALQAVCEGSRMSKAFAEEMGHDLLNDLSDCLYAGVAAWGLRKLNESGILSLLPPASHTIVTNVPGIPVPFYLCGCEMVDSFGLGPLIPNSGLFHTVSSTYDRFSIAIVADRAMMPDPDFYQQCLQNAFADLVALCEPHAVTSTHKNSRCSTADTAKKLTRETDNSIIGHIKKAAEFDAKTARHTTSELEDMISMLLTEETHKAVKQKT
jgi:WS/DGAT/MGAT family acyltransferase